MTSLSLLFWILLGISLQLAIFLGISFGRHWQNYLALKANITGSAPPAPLASHPEGVPGQGSWTDYRPFLVSRKVIEDAAGSICSFYLEPEDGQPLPRFRPGQFLTFRLEIPDGAGGVEPLVRCYSLSDAPRPDHYRVSIKRISASAGADRPPGRVSNHFHDQVQEGSLLLARAPAGHFYLDSGEDPVVLIAGGIGITPLLSMLNWGLTQQPGREIWLFYGVRNSHEAIMTEHLRALVDTHPQFKLRLCFSNPLATDQVGRDFHHAGRVDITRLRLELNLKPYHYFLCGPTPLLETLVPALEEWGVPPARIHFEAFGPASIPRRQPAPSPEPVAKGLASAPEILVTYARSGQQLTWRPDAGSLLDLAEAHDIAIPSGCRAGGCGTCQTRIASGEVSYRQPPDYDPEPGTCLLCVCTPKTAVTLEA